MGAAACIIVLVGCTADPSAAPVTPSASRPSASHSTATPSADASASSAGAWRPERGAIVLAQGAAAGAGPADAAGVADVGGAMGGSDGSTPEIELWIDLGAADSARFWRSQSTAFAEWVDHGWGTLVVHPVSRAADPAGQRAAAALVAVARTAPQTVLGTMDEFAVAVERGEPLTRSRVERLAADQGVDAAAALGDRGLREILETATVSSHRSSFPSVRVGDVTIDASLDATEFRDRVESQLGRS